MSADIVIRDHGGADQSVTLGGIDVSRFIKGVRIECEAGKAPKVFLQAVGDVEFQTDEAYYEIWKHHDVGDQDAVEDDAA